MGAIGGFGQPAQLPDPEETESERTALQKHVEFFDGNKDGQITVAETNAGLKALGMSTITAGPAALAINAGLAKSTTGRLLPLKVSVENIAKAKHPGDTDIYDEKGKFSPERFERMWRDFDKDKDGALNGAEIDGMIRTNSAPWSAGRVASKAEFKLLLSLAGKEDARGEKTLSREAMASFYDGSLFPKIAAERAGRPGGPAPTGAAAHDKDKVAGGLPAAARATAGALAGAGGLADQGAALATGADDAASRAAAAPMAGAMRCVCPHQP